MFISIPTLLFSQDSDDDGNKKPRIEGQREISMRDTESLTIQLLDLEVRDDDDWFYPFGFTLQVYDGLNYTRSGETITPVAGFEGDLSVPVTVYDGEEYSDVYNLKITVIGPNDPPVITGQQSVAVDEDQEFQLHPTHLIIEDPDDDSFTVMIHNGSHYTVSGSSIMPEANYNGLLSIPVQVNDGEASSNVFNLQLTVAGVNDPPIITSQQQLNTTNAAPLLIQLSHLMVQDVDNTYPDGFTLKVRDGNNYKRDGNQITPDANFTGNLVVRVRVNDGEADSETFDLIVNVTEGNDKPVITNQDPVIINEDQNFTLSFDHLKVFDRNDNYPHGFTLSIHAGDDYSVEHLTITPIPDFNGNLFVAITVNDGEHTSEPFDFHITVRPVNDAPIIASNVVSDSIFLKANTLTNIFNEISMSDVDNDSLALAEVVFSEETYSAGNDIIHFQSTEKIKGVFDSQNGLLALIGKASLQEYTDVLKSLQVEFTGNDISTSSGNKRIYASVNDGRANSNVIEKTIVFGEAPMGFDVPSGFTPNGDMVNDTWSIRPVHESEVYDAAVVRVYTKRGVLVFESQGLTTEWDGRYHGTLLPADVYFYTIEVQTDSPTNQEIKGIVTLLR